MDIRAPRNATRGARAPKSTVPVVYYFLIFAIAAVFYAVIPGIGAFYVRNRWRLFRRQIIEGSLFPIAEYRHYRGRGDGPVGTFRFFGELEAIQADDVVWLRNRNTSVSAELTKVPVFWLPSYSSVTGEGPVELNEETLPDEMPVQVSWHRVFSLPEGTKVFLSGLLCSETGNGVFRSSKQVPLTVVIYDDGKDTILRRAIWGGRHRNEYWNPFTPAALAAGSFGLLILAYILLRAPFLRLQVIVALSGSVLPLLPFLPPGLLLIFLYRNWWKRARFLRAERDLLLLPLRHFPGFTGSEDRIDAVFPNGAKTTMERFADGAAALSSLGSGKIRRAARLKTQPSDHAAYLFDGGRGVGGISTGLEDPMAERVMIPGNPVLLSRLCSRRARGYELLSSASFIGAVVVNLFVAMLVLASIIR